MRKDHMLKGVGLSLLIPIVMYSILWLGTYLTNTVAMPTFHEKYQLFIIALNGLLLRYVMVNRKQENTGKGIFIITFLMVIVYVVYYHL